MISAKVLPPEATTFVLLLLGGGRQNLEGGGGMSGDLTVFCGAKRNPHDFCQAPAEQMTTSLQKVSTTHSKSKALHFLSLNF